MRDEGDQRARGIGSIEVDPSPCIVGWSGCPESYTGGHYCERKARHEGDHVCICGARKRNG